MEKFMDLCNTIFSMKESYYATIAELTHSKAEICDSYKVAGKELKLFNEKWEYAYKGIIKHYLNVFEYACLLYNENVIDRSLFEKLFKNEVISIYKTNFSINVGIDLRNIENEDDYEQIIKTYNTLKGGK